jgi:hypothetical protein
MLLIEENNHLATNFRSISEVDIVTNIGCDLILFVRRAAFYPWSV